MLKSTLYATALAAAGVLVTGASVSAAPPVGAGGQLQQIPRTPEPERTIPDTRIEPGGKARDAGPAGPRVLVQSLHVTGETLFPEAELVAVTGFTPGRELDLRDLRLMAGRITDLYNRHGYFVAQAYLPAQDVQSGAVTIAVIEGRYGKVALDNHTNLSSRLGLRGLQGLKPGDPVASGPLERRLLLLSDLPGVRVKSTLSPGAAVGDTDLNVVLTPGPRVSGSIDGDNAGDSSTGRYRLGATLNVNNPTGHGDLITLRALSSFHGLSYGRAAYQTQLGDATVGASYAYLDYRLHGPFAGLRANGTAQIASLFASYPLLRSYDNNLVLLGGVDERIFKDRQDATASVVDKRERAVLVGISGDHHDSFGGGGWNQLSLGYTFGNLDIRTPAARLIDQTTSRANGGYGKFAYSVSRLQTLAGPLSIYGQFRGQAASKNLDVSEKMELGGAYAVRAYPEGLIYADDGYVATAEARLLLPRMRAPFPGRVQLIGFVDTASASANHTPWLPGPNHERVSGAGFGANWISPNNFIVRAAYAHAIGSPVGVPGPVSSGRVWLQFVKFF